MKRTIDYSSSKLLTIATTQDGMLYNYELMGRLLSCDANGVIVYPADDPGGTTCSMANTDFSKARRVVGLLIDEILNAKSNTKLWIGTPYINEDNYSDVVYGTDTNSAYARLVKYADHFMKQSYSSKIYGFLYNQNAIYGDFDASRPITCPQVKLMSDFSNYLKDTYDVDLIWAPNYGIDDNETIRIAAVANTLSCFDCTFLQSMYIDTNVTTSEAMANFKAIVSTIDNNGMLYKHNSDSTFYSGTSKSAMGVVYQFVYDQKDTKFVTYRNDYIGLYCPKVFNWQGLDESDESTCKKQLTEMVKIIDEVWAGIRP